MCACVCFKGRKNESFVIRKWVELSGLNLVCQKSWQADTTLLSRWIWLESVMALIVYVFFLIQIDVYTLLVQISSYRNEILLQV